MRKNIEGKGDGFAVCCRERKKGGDKRGGGEGRGNGGGLASRWEHDMMLLIETCITTGINCIRERLIIYPTI